MIRERMKEMKFMEQKEDTDCRKIQGRTVSRKCVGQRRIGDITIPDEYV